MLIGKEGTVIGIVGVCLLLAKISLAIEWESDTEPDQQKDCQAEEFAPQVGQSRFSDLGETKIYQRNLDLPEDDDDLFPEPNGSGAMSPIIMVPGYGGSRLEARWRKKESAYPFCPLESHWSTIWLTAKILLPFSRLCYKENILLNFDPATNRTSNYPGVDIRVKYADKLASIDTINDRKSLPFYYFGKLTAYLIEKLNYKRDVNIRAASYDFRKAPNELGDHFAKMKKTVQKLSKSNGRGVTFICHSMGCNHVLYFLKDKSKSWKAKHIKRVIGLGAPWVGSVSAVRSALLGYDYNSPFPNRGLFREVQRTFPSTMFLFPHPKVFGNITIIRTHLSDREDTGSFKASTKDYETIFEKLKYPIGYEMYKQTKDLVDPEEPPGVELWCFHGHGYDTLSRLDFEGELPNSRETKVFADGDGTVPTSSANYCGHWARHQRETIHLISKRVKHLDMMKDIKVMEFIVKILSN